MSLVRHQRATGMLLFVAIAMIGLAGCSLGSDGDDKDPTPTAVSQVSGEDQVTAAEEGAPSNLPANPTAGPTPTPRISSYDADGDGFMTPDELRTAVNATLPEFPFPPEYRVTGDQIADQFFALGMPGTTEGEPFEAGFEYLLIAGHHQCSWERVYLQANASGDATAQKQAINALFAGQPKYQYGSEADREMIADYWRKAQLGDPRLVARDVDLNCNGIGLLTPVAET